MNGRCFAIVFSLALCLVPVSAFAASSGELFQKSYEAESKYNYQEALNLLEKIKDKQSYIYDLRHGWLLYNLGKYDNSATAYRRAIKRERRSTEARLGLMLPLMAARKWEDAKAVGRQVLNAEPGSYLATSRMAYINFNQARYLEAEETYKDVLSKYPGDLDMRAGLGWTVFKQGRYIEARDEFKKVLAVSPNHTVALEGISYCP
jgi:tetratricopeptide (TPR) repeat protein